MIDYSNLELGTMYIAKANEQHGTEANGTECYAYIRDDSYNLGILRDDYSNEMLMCVFITTDKKLSTNSQKIIDKIKKGTKLTNVEINYIEEYWRGGIYVKRFDFIKKLDKNNKETNIYVL